MKQFIFILVALFLSFAALTQERIEVKVESQTMSQGEQTSFSVFVPEASVELVADEWKKFINDRSFGEILKKSSKNIFNDISGLFSKEKKEKKQLKVTESNNEYFVKNVTHEDVSSRAFDVYGRFNLKANGVEVWNFFRYSDGDFISRENSSEELITSISSYIRLFGIDAYKAVYEKKINEQEKILKGENGKLSSLERENKSLNKSISRIENDIYELEEDIRFEEGQQHAIRIKISEMKKSLRTISRKSEEYDMLKSTVKTFEKDYKKSGRKVKKSVKKISNNRSKISEIDAKVIANEKAQENQHDVIAKQEAVIEELKKFQDNIK